MTISNFPHLHNCDDTPGASQNIPHDYDGWTITSFAEAANLVDDAERGMHWLAEHFPADSNQAACVDNTRELLRNIAIGLKAAHHSDPKVKQAMAAFNALAADH